MQPAGNGAGYFRCEESGKGGCEDEDEDEDDAADEVDADRTVDPVIGS